MQEQLIKMAAAALGITTEQTQEVITEVMTFVQTANARIGAIELQTADVHRMMLDLHKVEFPEMYPRQNAVDIMREHAPKELEGLTNGGTAADGGNT